MTTGLPPIDATIAPPPSTEQPRTRKDGQSFERLLDARHRSGAATRTGARRRSDAGVRPAPSADDQARATRATARVAAEQRRTPEAAPIEPVATPIEPVAAPIDPANAVAAAAAAATQQMDAPASTYEAAATLAAPGQAAVVPASITRANAEAPEEGTGDAAPLATNAEGTAFGGAGATTEAAAAPQIGAEAPGRAAVAVPPGSAPPRTMSATPLRPATEAPPPLIDTVCEAPASGGVALAPQPGSTPLVPDATAPPTPVAQAPIPDPAAVVASAIAAGADTGAGDAASSEDAPHASTGLAATARPVRRPVDAPAPPTHAVDSQAPTPTATATDPASVVSTVPIARSESLARVLDAMTAADRTSAPLTRLAVELDDATRVSVRVHGQSVHVDVIADDAGRLDSAWRRDVAQGIKRHGLEYERDGADANDGRGRRRDEPTPTTARDGGRRSRRFTIDLDTATPS